jgi:hypothetical protein
MVEIYLDEATKRSSKRTRGVKPSDQEWQRGRSDAGKRISGDENTGPRYYTLGRSRGASPDDPTAPGVRPKNTPKLAGWEKDDIQYRKANLKAGRIHKVGGERGLPESFDDFDIILKYLVVEGYADTNEDALAIMANMSEGWKESILDEGYRPIGKKREKAMYRRAGNLARTSLASTGRKKLEAAKKSAKIVGVITRQKENERFDEIGKSPENNP